MSLKIRIAAACFLIGTMLLVLHFSLFPNQEKKDRSEAQSINLALRQMAHQLYLVEGDSERSIPPVKQFSTHHFLLDLNKKVNYDTLPFLLNQALLDFDIPLDYEVAIKHCMEDNILLGYNRRSFQNSEVPCMGRDQVADCTKIDLLFSSDKKRTYKYIIGVIFFFSMGMITLFFGSFSNFHSSKALKPLATEKGKLIRLANSHFRPKDLSVTVNNHTKTLTFRETKLLMYFFNNPRQILHRDDIKHHVWGDEGVIVGRSLDVFVSRLRKILKEDELLEIKNVHGVGYRLEVK